VASGRHVMQEFVHIEDNELMSNAGDHFPFVYRNGEPASMN